MSKVTAGPSAKDKKARAQERLVALSKEAAVDKVQVQVQARGRWLEEQHRSYLREHGGDTEPPSLEEVARQIRLPSRAQVEAGDWVDPAKRWVEVAPSAGWGWARHLLPQEEEGRGRGWRPPTPPRPDRSLLGYIQHFQAETPAHRPTPYFLSKDAVLLSVTQDNNLEDSAELVVYDKSHSKRDSACVLRTTKHAVIKAKNRREQEERRAIGKDIKRHDVFSRLGSRGHSPKRKRKRSPSCSPRRRSRDRKEYTNSRPQRRVDGHGEGHGHSAQRHRSRSPGGHHGHRDRQHRRNKDSQNSHSEERSSYHGEEPSSYHREGRHNYRGREVNHCHRESSSHRSESHHPKEQKAYHYHHRERDSHYREDNHYPEELSSYHREYVSYQRDRGSYHIHREDNHHHSRDRDSYHRRVRFHSRGRNSDPRYDDCYPDNVSHYSEESCHIRERKRSKEGERSSLQSREDNHHHDDREYSPLRGMTQ